MIIRALVILCLVAATWPGRAAAQAWPNEPSGATVLNDWGHNLITGGGWYDVYGEGGTSTIVTDVTAPLSPTNVLQQRWPNGGVGGNTGGGGNAYIFSAFQPDIYWGNWMKVDANFEQHPSGSKIGWIHTRLNNVPMNNQLFYSLIGTGPYCLRATYQNATVNNSHIGESAGLGTANFYPSSASCFNGGTWVRIEQYFRPASCITCRNGIWKMWVNGTLVMNLTTLNSELIYPDAVSHITVWGGTGSVKTRDSFIWWDHEHVSSPNCPLGGCGSAGSDTTPPSQVTGVVATVNGTTATLTWPVATDNVAVTGYQAESCIGGGCTNFSNLSTTSMPSMVIPGLAQGTTYVVRIKAYDAAGNVSSSYSAPVTFSISGVALPSVTMVEADATGANVAWTGSPAAMRVSTDTLNIIEPMSAFPVASETIAHVQSRSVSGSGNSISLAYASNNTAGNFLALRLTASPSSVTISNCSDTRGNTWEAVPNATGGSGGYQAIRYAKNVLAGANTVTCTLTGAATFSTLDIFEKSGVDRTAPLDQSKLTQQVDPGTGTDAISSGSVTTTADGELILGATLQVGATVYSASADFSSTQGPVWYYKDSSGANLSWTGTYWAGTGYLSLWDTGGHPGTPLDAMRRWVAPADGSVRVTGTALNYSGCGSNGTIVTIKKNGTTLWTQLVTGTTSYPYDVSTTVVATDTLDFLINNNGLDTCDSTQFDPTITLGTASGSGGTTTSAGTGFTLRHATVSDSPSADQVQSTAGPIAATFTGADALNDYITSIATFKPAASSIRYSRVWPTGTTFVCMTPRDAEGNENTSPSGYHCNSVTPGTDTVEPVRSSPQPSGTFAAGTEDVTISVATNEFATCRYATSAGVSYGSMGNTLDASSNSLFHSKTIAGHSNGNSYSYYVRCQDAFLNANLTDSTISFSIASSDGDVSAPSKVTGLAGEVLNSSQISLSWLAATDNVGVTGYEIYAAASGSDYSLAGTSSSTSSIISGLSQSTLYLVKVRARDAVGNFGSDSDAIVLLTTPSDIHPPSDLVGMAASAVDFQALDLSWTAGTDDVGITSTNIEQCRGVDCTDFLLVAAVTSGTTLRVSGLLPQTTYRFRAKHADAAGNVSLNYSTVVTGTTLAVPVGTVTAVCRCKHHR